MSLYCELIPMFCTGVIILANIMLTVVSQTAKTPNKMTANISGYIVFLIEQDGILLQDSRRIMPEMLQSSYVVQW